MPGVHDEGIAEGRAPAVGENQSMTVSIRRGVPGDAAGLVHLRALMFEAMHEPTKEDDTWRGSFVAWAAEQLATDEVAAFVAWHPTEGLVSAALGQVNRHAPSPHNPVGLSGHVSNVVTAPAFRGQGLARGCLEALMEWFRDSTAVQDINLSATVDGSGLYRKLGFAERAYPSMRLILDRSSLVSTR
jgi:GNAT superfamily N-acetyltransferase